MNYKIIIIEDYAKEKKKNKRSMLFKNYCKKSCIYNKRLNNFAINNII